VNGKIWIALLEGIEERGHVDTLNILPKYKMLGVGVGRCHNVQKRVIVK
jgi:hypothetical protein